jgi:hypothetical protein
MQDTQSTGGEKAGGHRHLAAFLDFFPMSSISCLQIGALVRAHPNHAWISAAAQCRLDAG